MPTAVELVDLEGFEPSTSSMPLRRAPNCATGPPIGTIPSLKLSIQPRLATAAALKAQAYYVPPGTCHLHFLKSHDDEGRDAPHEQAAGRQRVNGVSFDGCSSFASAVLDRSPDDLFPDSLASEGAGHKYAD